MKKHASIVLNLLIFLHFLLIFLLVFETQVKIPFWIQPLGRMHPLILHFPVAFITLLVIINLISKRLDKASFKKINLYLLLTTSFLTTLATLMGFILSLESSSTNTLLLHKWIGVSISFLLFTAIYLVKNKRLYRGIIYSSFVCLLFTGHFGSELTHGNNFISDPIMSVISPRTEMDETIYLSFVQPIFDRKCIMCHNDQNQKGGLNLTTFTSIEKGGEKGAFWLAHLPEESNVIKRLQLPIDDKNHMPPKVKPQLTENEIELIKAWIKHGANDTISIDQLEHNSPLETIISKKWIKEKPIKENKYDFSFVDSKTIESLNGPYRRVVQKSPTIPAIDVTIFGRSKFNSNRLTELEKIKDQIVYLNLSNLPIKRKHLDFINGLSNLEKLILNSTEIESNDLMLISNCKKLKSISISNTSIDKLMGNALKKLENLKEVFAWKTNISHLEMQRLKREFSHIIFVEGANNENKNKKYQLSPPILLNKGNVINISDTIDIGHKLNGTLIRFTLDGSDPTNLSNILPHNFFISLEGSRKKTIKTIVSKKGWIDSEIKSFTFYDKGILPDFFKVTHEGIFGEYTGSAEHLLIDNYVMNSEEMISSRYWAAYKEKPLVAEAHFKSTEKQISEIILSYGLRSRYNKKLNPKVSPLKYVEVWSSKDSLNWELETKKRFSNFTFTENKTVNIMVKNKNRRYFRIIAQPEKKSTIYVNQIFFF